MRRSNVRSRLHAICLVSLLPAAVPLWDSRASEFPVAPVFLKPWRSFPFLSFAAVLSCFKRVICAQARRDREKQIVLTRSLSIHSPICVCGSRCLLIPRLRVFRAPGIVCAHFVAHSGALRYRVASFVRVVVVRGSTRSLLHDLPCAV